MTEEIKSQLDYFKDEPKYLRKVIEELEQENKELKAYKDVNEDFKKAWDELNERYKLLRSALEEIREKAQHCIRQDACALCDYSKECAVPDVEGLVYDNNRLLIKLINEVLNP